jgi:hypothetical protein
VLDQQQGALPGTLFRIRLPRSGADRRQMTDMSGARA